MADRFRRTYPVRITWTEGEQPTYQKLNAVSEQSRNGLALIERAIGDLWNQSGDTLLFNFPLQLPNLARIIGENRFLNPVIYPTTDAFFIVEDMSRHSTLTEGFLLYAPTDLDNFSVVSDTQSKLLSRKTFVTDVAADGDYFISSSSTSSRFFIRNRLTSIVNETVIKYEVNPPDDWILSQAVLPGVIPDQRQGEFLGCRIEEVTPGSKYYLHLPPRRPLVLDSTVEKPFAYPSDTMYEANTATTFDAADLRFWQAGDVDAMAHRHYRYSFPRELLQFLDSMSAGDIIPDGYMYLWDQTNKTIVYGIVFKKDFVDYEWTVEIESTSIDLASISTVDESAASYNSGYSLITVGAPLAQSMWQATTILLNHAHTNADFTATINHVNIARQNPTSAGGPGITYPTYLPSWPALKWTGDSHSSLLSRIGARTVAAEQRDEFNNAMIGHLLIGNADESGSFNFLDDGLPDSSFKIYFGDVTGPAFWADTASGFWLEGKTNTRLSINSTAGHGYQDPAIDFLTSGLKGYTLGVRDDVFELWDKDEAGLLTISPSNSLNSKNGYSQEARTVTYYLSGSNWLSDDPDKVVANEGTAQASLNLDVSSTDSYAVLPLRLPKSGTVTSMRVRYRLAGVPAGGGIKLTISTGSCTLASDTGSQTVEDPVDAYTGTSTASLTLSLDTDMIISETKSYQLMAQCESGTGVTAIRLGHVEVDISTTEPVYNTHF